MPKKLTQEEFIERARKIHENKYDYSLVEYIGASKKIKIICPEHGVFEQEASSHKKGFGCPRCRNTRKYSNEKFIKKANIFFGNLYDYSKTKYTLAHNKVIITCKKHGDFEVYAYQHLQGAGCQKCSAEKNSSTGEDEIDNFIKSLGYKTLRHSKKIIPPYEIDIFIPFKNIAIEFNGLYWHSEKGLNKKDAKYYHLNKTKEAEKKGIRMIQIFEDEWYHEKEEIQKIITFALKKEGFFTSKEVIFKNNKAITERRFGLKLYEVGYKLQNQTEPNFFYTKGRIRTKNVVCENKIYDCGKEIWIMK